MEKITINKVEAFRHQLWLNHIAVIDEYEHNDTTCFVLESSVLTSYDLQRLAETSPFSILQLGYEGNFKLEIMILNE